MTDYLVIDNSTSRVVGIGSPTRRVVTGELVYPVSDALTLNRRLILQGARVTVTNNVITSITYPSAATPQAVNAAYRSFRAQLLRWEADLIQFGLDVYRTGTVYLDGGDQGGQKVLGDPVTYPHADAIKIFTFAEQGADLVTSAEIFADSVYALRAAPSPTRALLWADANGRRALSNMVDYGARVDRRPFAPPADSVWRT